MDVDLTLDIAIKVAEDAGRLLMGYFGKSIRREAKSVGNFVSEADRKAEELIVSKLKRHFPDSGFLAEEGTLEDSKNGLTWVIDPLDGTNNFLHGFPHWAVSIGATWNGSPLLGVIHHPPMREMMAAGLGRGCWLDGRKVTVSKVRHIPEALLATGFSYDTGETLRRSMRMFQAFQDNGQTIRRPGAAALDLACVAAGRFDGYWESGLKPWDCAAGLICVAEAGGTLSTYDGSDYVLGGHDLVVSNGLLHPEMLRRLKPFA